MVNGVIATFLLVALGLGGATGAGAELATVRVAQIPIASSLPFYVAQEKKFFEEEGLKLEVQNMAGGAVILPALTGGSMDIGFTNYITVIVAAEKGFDYTIIAPQNRAKIVRIEGRDEDQSPVMVLEASGIKGPKELKGKIVAVNTFRNINDLYAYEWLERHGLDPKNDVRWVEIPFPQMGPALRSRKVDAAFMTEPFATVEQDAGGVKAIGFPYIEVQGKPTVEIAGYVATKSWIEKNPDLVQRFVRAFNKGMDYTIKHPEEWGAILAKYTRMKPELVTRIRMMEWHRPVDVVSLQTQADLAMKWGLIKERVDVNRIVHTTAR